MPTDFERRPIPAGLEPGLCGFPERVFGKA